MTYNLRRVRRVVARMRHGHLALVDAAGPAVAGVDPAGRCVAGHVEVVVVARHLCCINGIVSYWVTRVVAHLGCIDLDLGCSTILLWH